MIAVNNGDIPMRDLRDVADIVALNHAYVCGKWDEMFGVDAVRFYR